MSPRGLRLLADDLSGALDSAVAFASAGERAVSVAFRPDAAFACNIGTRDLPAAEAASRLRAALPWLLAAPLPFLKIDSRLRGHVADALPRLARRDRPVIVAPAVPAQGRVVRGGRVLTRDASGAVTVEPVDLVGALAAAGVALSVRRPGDPVADGVSVCDSESDADLDRIVRVALADPRPVVLCGASGLAAALARAHGLAALSGVGVRRPLLMVVGTAHPSALEQVARFDAARPGAHARIDGADRPPACDPLLVTARIPEGSAPGEVSARVGGMLAAVARGPKPGTLFVTGGATLEALCGHLGAHAIAVSGEFRPGVPAGRLKGGAWDGVRLVAKSGGFAGPDILVELSDVSDPRP